MPLTHDQKRTVVRLWTTLEEARNTVAETRSSIYLSGANVDQVTLAIVGLQDRLVDVLRKDEVPKQPSLMEGLWPRDS